MKWRDGVQNKMTLWYFGYLVFILFVFLYVPCRAKDFIVLRPSFLVSSAIIDLASDIRTAVVNSNAEKMANQHH